MTRRRTFLGLSAALAALAGGKSAFAFEASTGLRGAPITLAGDWRNVSTNAVQTICDYIRNVCFTGFDLVSDRQPSKLRIENRTSGYPAVWLHADNPDTASILLNTGAAAWAQLAYQLGHEFGHVLCNSWQLDAKPALPSQWIEETLAETFSVTNLGALGRAWQQKPPFRGNEGYGKSILDYRGRLVAEMEQKSAPAAQVSEWLRSKKGELAPLVEGRQKLSEGLVLLLVSRLDEERSLAAELGAVNQWPQRSRLPMKDYLAAWQKSCRAVRLNGTLPTLILDHIG